MKLFFAYDNWFYYVFPFELKTFYVVLITDQPRAIKIKARHDKFDVLLMVKDVTVLRAAS